MFCGWLRDYLKRFSASALEFNGLRLRLGNFKNCPNSRLDSVTWKPFYTYVHWLNLLYSFYCWIKHLGLTVGAFTSTMFIPHTNELQ